MRREPIFHSSFSLCGLHCFGRHTVAVICLLGASGAVTVRAEEVQLETNLQKLSYGLGMRFGEQMKQQLLRQGLDEADPEAIAAGVLDVLRGVSSRVRPDELQAAAQAVQAAELKKRDAMASANKAKGEQFLARNASADGVVSLDSGLQYRILNAASGPRPTLDSKVRVHYIGRLLNGAEFDSSRARDEPAEFNLGAVIKGWQEVVQLMPAGSTWEAWIPSELAYGARGAGSNIGPNETLHFDIELIKVLTHPAP